MKLLLDTHTFLWFVLDSPKLVKAAKELITNSDYDIYVRLIQKNNYPNISGFSGVTCGHTEYFNLWNGLSMASYWEIAIKTSLEKLNLPADFEDFIPHQIFINHMALLSIETSYLNQVAKLPFHHRDPFDRFLISQCMVENIPIISNDIAFDQYPIERLWNTVSNDDIDPNSIAK